MTEDEPRQDPTPQDARLASLDERLRAAKQMEAGRRGEDHGRQDESYRQGSRVLSYLIGGPLGGALIGWVLDRALGTFPWIMLTMLVLGTVAGFRSILKMSAKRPD